MEKRNGQQFGRFGKEAVMATAWTDDILDAYEDSTASEQWN